MDEELRVEAALAAAESADALTFSALNPLRFKPAQAAAPQQGPWVVRAAAGGSWAPLLFGRR